MSLFKLCVESMLALGSQLSIDTGDLQYLCVKVIVVNLKYVDRATVWKMIFPSDGCNHFVDWDLVKPNVNMLGDLQLWIPLLSMCSWEGLERYEDKMPPLVNMRKGLKSVGMDDGSYTLPCRLLIAHLLRCIPSLQAFETITCQMLQRSTHTNSALLLAYLGDSMMPPEVYQDTLSILLSPDVIRVDVSKVSAYVKAAAAKQMSIRESMEMKVTNAVHGRPRLRDKLQQTEKQKVDADCRLGTWESYVAFNQLHQFCNMRCESVKSKLYFLASQTTWDWRAHVAVIVGKEGELADQIRKYPISVPDLPVLCRVIEGLSMDGCAPFQGLTDFKNRCFKSFPVSEFKKMTLGHFLRLYVCVYQNPGHWKDLWKLQVGLLSPQIIRDCEAFAHAEPFEAESFMRLLARGPGL